MQKWRFGEYQSGNFCRVARKGEEKNKRYFMLVVNGADAAADSPAERTQIGDGIALRIYAGCREQLRFICRKNLSRVD